MNILFIYSLDSGLRANGLLYSQGQLQLGISYISSLLQKYGHRTELAVVSRLFGRKNKTILKEYLNKFRPRLICFTAVATQYSFIASIAKYIKRYYPDIYLLVGGVHVALNPHEVLFDDFDALCIGEGEYPTLELVLQLEKKIIPSDIPNLWIKHGSKIEKNLTREFLQELDSLPFLDRKMWQKWMNQKSPQECTILLSRGCPFNCSYCCNHAIRKTAQGIYVRYRSPKNIVEEIKEILIDFPTIKEIFLETETIAANMNWCIEFCSELEHFNVTISKSLSFGTNIRITPNLDLDNIFSALKRSNFRFINIGFESGSERVRREILRRDYSNYDVINTVKLARKYGLQVNFCNLIGIPGETLADFKETIVINRICKPDGHTAYIFFPYPGTDLYFLCKEQGLLKGPLDPREERSRATLDIPGFSKKQIQKSFTLFNYYICNNLDPEDKLAILILRLKDFNRFLDRLSFLKYLKKPFKEYTKNLILNGIKKKNA